MLRPLLFLQGMQYLNHLPYLKVRCLCILHDSYLKWKETVLVRNQKNSNKKRVHDVFRPETQTEIQVSFIPMSWNLLA
jgi:hypothetical protein